MTNIILEFELELRLYLENKMREPLTNQEILALFDEKFPWKKGLTPKSIADYRKRYVPEYKSLLLQRYGKEKEQKPAEIEEEILEEVRAADTEKEEFSADEQKKLNQIRAHRKVLKELWENYLKVRHSKEEVAKGRYLELMSRELEKLGELEQTERSFLSAMDEVRKAEAKLTIVQLFDSLTGWFMPRMVEKAKDNGQALEYLFRLQLFCNDYSKLLLENPIEQANKILLDKLYAYKKIEKEDDVNVG
jgi:hypothetical protein